MLLPANYPNAAPQSGRLSPFPEALMRGVVWALKGSVFGVGFLILHEYFREQLPPPLLYLVATAGAGTFGAMVYGSMRLTLIVAAYAFVAVIGTFVFIGPVFAPHILMAVGGMVGLLIGMIYGFQVKSSRVFRAEAKVIAGAFAGVVASVTIILPSFLFEPLAYPWLTAIVCPAVGLVYAITATWFVNRCCDLLPAPLDGALVGGGVGVVLGLLFWLMASSIESQVPEQHAAFVSNIFLFWPAAVGGAALTAFFAGVARSMLGVRWLDI